MTREISVSRLSVVGAIAFIIAGVFGGTAAFAAPTGLQYAAPEQAVAAFIGALRKNDTKTLLRVFGREAAPVFNSEDAVADAAAHKRFLELYDVQNRLTTDAQGAMVLTVGSGAEAWPFPIPLVKARRGWAFDTAAGVDEIVNRRVGRNELQTLQTCLAIVRGQYEYYSRDRDGDGILEYAQLIRSSPGLRDGLYWPAEPDEKPSPLGELAAAAAAEGYTNPRDAYHGYRYKVLTAQGPTAPDGAYEYLVRGNQIGGFALLAYPAAYGDSGVMSFIVNHAGVIYQRDLGGQTESEALKLQVFDPGAGWTRVPDEDLAPIPEE